MPECSSGLVPIRSKYMWLRVKPLNWVHSSTSRVITYIYAAYWTIDFHVSIMREGLHRLHYKGYSINRVQGHIPSNSARWDTYRLHTTHMMTASNTEYLQGKLPRSYFEGNICSVEQPFTHKGIHSAWTPGVTNANSNTRYHYSVSTKWTFQWTIIVFILTINNYNHGGDKRSIVLVCSSNIVSNYSMEAPHWSTRRTATETQWILANPLYSNIKLLSNTHLQLQCFE